MDVLRMVGKCYATGYGFVQPAPKTVTQLLRENPAERDLLRCRGNDFPRQRSQLSGVLFTQDHTGRGIPGYFLGYSERTGASFSNGSGSEASWIYDPIDGAYHYLMGLPLWSSSLALVVNGETRAAFV